MWLSARWDGRSNFNVLDFRAPEDRVSGAHEVSERYRVPVRSQEVDRAVRKVFDAWSSGDDDLAKAAAAHLIDRTGAHFQMQGVPVFARPVLPPQFVKEFHDALWSAPEGTVGRIAEALASKFDVSVQKQVMGELTGKAPEPHVAIYEGTGRPFLGGHVSSSGRSNGHEVALRLDGMEEGRRDGSPPNRPQGAPQRQSQSGQAPAQSQHPDQAQEDADQSAWCKRELSVISSMWYARQSYATERERLQQEIARVGAGDDSNIQAQLGPLRDELRAKEHELKLLYLPSDERQDCKWVRDRRGRQTKVCKPGMGWIPESVRHQQRLKLEAEIGQLRQKIASLESQLKAPRLATLKAQLAKVCAKLRESSALLVPMQQKYEQTCNRQLSPWPESMKPVPGCG